MCAALLLTVACNFDAAGDMLEVPLVLLSSCLSTLGMRSSKVVWPPVRKVPPHCLHNWRMLVSKSFHSLFSTNQEHLAPYCSIACSSRTTSMLTAQWCT